MQRGGAGKHNSVPCWEHRVTTPTQATLRCRASLQCVTAVHQQDSASQVHIHNHTMTANKECY